MPILVTMPLLLAPSSSVRGLMLPSSTWAIRPPATHSASLACWCGACTPSTSQVAPARGAHTRPHAASRRYASAGALPVAAAALLGIPALPARRRKAVMAQSQSDG